MGNTVTKNKQGYGYMYTDLAQIHNYLESINARYIQQIQRIENEDYVMTKRCFDDKWEDEWLQGCKVVNAVLSGKSNPAQEQGSALTYARRYSLLMAFGLATEDDDAESLTREPTINKTMEESLRKMILDNGIDNDLVIKALAKFSHTKLSELTNDEVMKFRKELGQ